VPSSEVVLQAFTDLAPRYEEITERELGQYLGLEYAASVDGLLALAAVKPGEAVLDIATGTALIPRRLAQKIDGPGAIVGLDLTPAMLRQAQAALDQDGSAADVRLVCASGLALPFVPASFDVILCGFGTHHMSIVAMLSEIRRVLKGGGRIALAAAGAPPYWRSFWARALVQIVRKLAGLLHGGARIQAQATAFSNVWTAAEWLAALSGAGFTNFKVAEAPAHRRWYPRALTISAGTGGT